MEPGGFEGFMYLLVLGIGARAAHSGPRVTARSSGETLRRRKDLCLS